MPFLAKRESRPGGSWGFGSVIVPLEDFKKLANVSIQCIWGDLRFIKKKKKITCFQYSRLAAEFLESYGGKLSVLMLAEDADLTDNTHIAVVDMDVECVAGLLGSFLGEHLLDG